ncbi:MAG: hypothetical protein AABX72_01770, partial [Nanoarchaeota archaeon]
ILNNGNVGIGTASPTDKLQVNNGNILVQSGNILFESPNPANPSNVTNEVSFGGGGSLNGNDITYTVTFGSNFGETQAPNPPAFVTAKVRNGYASFSLAPPSDPRVTGFHVYRKKKNIDDTLENNYNFYRIGFWKLPKDEANPTIVGNSKLEKVANSYKFTDSGVPTPSVFTGLPDYPTFAAGFYFKNETESDYTSMLRMMRTGGASYIGVNTDRPRELFEVLGVGSTPATSLASDGSSGKTARVRITDTIGNPELQLQYGSGSSDHWGIYADNDTGDLRFSNGDNKLVIGSDGHIKTDVFMDGTVNIGTSATAIRSSVSLIVKGKIQAGGLKLDQLSTITMRGLDGRGTGKSADGTPSARYAFGVCFDSGRHGIPIQAWVNSGGEGLNENTRWIILGSSRDWEEVTTDPTQGTVIRLIETIKICITGGNKSFLDDVKISYFPIDISNF